MSGQETRRPPPLVIRVPPPDGALVSPYVGYLLCVVFVGIALPLAPWRGDAVMVALAALFVILGAASISAVRWSNRRYARRRCKYLVETGLSEDDPAAAAILAEWRGPSATVKTKAIRAALNKAADSPAAGARIVCLGMLDVPEVGDLFFEPEIITPTRSIGRRIVFIPIAAAVVAVWLLQELHVLPNLRIQLSSFGYLLFMGLVVTAVWAWRGMIRPRYIRMAPGIIQVLEYPYGKGKPAIRSYPLDSETVAVVHGSLTGRKRRPQNLTLLRNEREDKIDFSQMRRAEEVVERTWQALLTTAPTPPLSDEELIG